ncbi:MAG: S9 family peptidase [Candidatus Sericytochromatia bacterium]
MNPSAFAAATPPVAERIPHEITVHGDTRVDPYFWLREEENPKVISYLEAENAYTQDYMADTAPLQSALYDELKSYLIESDRSVPFAKGGYWYYSRIDKGQNYRVYCRRKGSMEGPEEVLLDLNLLAEGKEYLNMGVFEVSPDQRYLAYSLDTSGAEAYTLFVKDLQTGELLSDQIEGTYYSTEWAADSQTLFYNVIDEANRPFKVFRHRLGTAVEQDVLVHHEPDERFNVGIHKTSSEKYLILELESNTTHEQAYIPADTPEAKPVVIQPRIQGLEYTVEHHGQDFIIHTNEGATNFKVVRAPIAQPGRAHWQTLIEERTLAKLESIQVFDTWMTAVFRTDARMQVEAHHLLNGRQQVISFPDTVASIWPGGEQDYASNTLRVAYASLVTPWTVFDVHLNDGTLELRKQDQIAGYDPADYVMEREYATAADGTRVPLTLVYRKGLKKDGSNPTYLYSYGSYGISTDPDFNAQAIALLKRGFVYAIAHIRGGEEMGRRWYENGKLLNKRNTFTDFISVAEHLIAQGYTRPDQLAIEGGSAGGLLMGAVSNLRPDLFQSVIADVPFVDALNTMLDPSLPLTVIEYEEWGNPNEKVYYDYIKSYSPYDNLSAQNYPHMLVLAGLNDPRVKYWEPAKLVARLRTLKTDSNTLLLRTNMSAGHSGASGRYEALKEEAFKYAYLLKTLGRAN